MRENRPYGSEGGGAEFNQPFLPLSMGKFASMLLPAPKFMTLLQEVRSRTPFRWNQDTTLGFGSFFDHGRDSTWTYANSTLRRLRCIFPAGPGLDSMFRLWTDGAHRGWDPSIHK